MPAADSLCPVSVCRGNLTGFCIKCYQIGRCKLLLYVKTGEHGMRKWSAKKAGLAEGVILVDREWTTDQEPVIRPEQDWKVILTHSWTAWRTGLEEGWGRFSLIPGTQKARANRKAGPWPGLSWPPHWTKWYRSLLEPTRGHLPQGIFQPPSPHLCHIGPSSPPLLGCLLLSRLVSSESDWRGSFHRSFPPAS